MSKTLRRAVARRMVEARNHTGLRVCDFARLMGVTTRTVSRWEAGDRVPTLIELCQVATYSGLTLTWLLFDACEQRAKIAKEGRA